MNNEPVSFTLVGDGQKKKFNKKGKDLITYFSPSCCKLLIPELISNYHAFLISLKDIKLFEYGISPISFMMLMRSQGQ